MLYHTFPTRLKHLRWTGQVRSRIIDELNRTPFASTFYLPFPLAEPTSIITIDGQKFQLLSAPAAVVPMLSQETGAPTSLATSAPTSFNNPPSSPSLSPRRAALDRCGSRGRAAAAAVEGAASAAAAAAAWARCDTLRLLCFPASASEDQSRSKRIDYY